MSKNRDHSTNDADDNEGIRSKNTSKLTKVQGFEVCSTTINKTFTTALHEDILQLYNTSAQLVENLDLLFSEQGLAVREKELLAGIEKRKEYHKKYNAEYMKTKKGLTNLRKGARVYKPT